MKSPTQPASRHSQELLLAIADLRRLAVQNILVAQSEGKTASDMWTSCREAHRGQTELLLQSQRLELETMRTKEQLNTALQRERLVREALEKAIADRDESIADLRNQITSYQYANQDLSHSTAKLTEAIWDLADADDVEVERERIQVRYDTQELRCAYLERQMESVDGEKSRVEEELQRLKEQFAHFCAECNREIIDKDETIYMLRSFVGENGPCPPA